MGKKKGLGAMPKEKAREIQSKGGRARVSKGAAKISKEQRRENGRKGAEARWRKEKHDTTQTEDH